MDRVISSNVIQGTIYMLKMSIHYEYMLKCVSKKILFCFYFCILYEIDVHEGDFQNWQRLIKIGKGY